MFEVDPGKYVVIEGPDGSGKTTQKDLLVQMLKDIGKDPVDLIEPGGTRVGLELRKIILDGNIVKLPETELDLFTVARRELVREVIAPSLANGNDVISDRNWFSSIAYQGFGRGLDRQMIIERSQQVLGIYANPDSVTILDVPPELCVDRMLRIEKKADWFERQGEDFFKRIQEGYHWIADEFNIPLIDGVGTIEEVTDRIHEHLGKTVVGLFDPPGIVQ